MHQWLAQEEWELGLGEGGGAGQFGIDCSWGASSVAAAIQRGGFQGLLVAQSGENITLQAGLEGQIYDALWYKAYLGWRAITLQGNIFTIK